MSSNKRARMEEQQYLLKNQNHFVNQNNMRLSGQLCDVTIKVNEREFRAHKNILAANLKYFQSMFLNPFQESKQDVVVMQDVDATDLEVFISFAYAGEMLLTESNALGLLKVANYLSEGDIKGSCIEFLRKNLKVEEACQAYQFSNAIDCLSLRNVARQVILTNFQKCSQIGEYFDFDYESLREILCDAQLASKPQESLFEGIMRWVLHDVKNRQVHIDDLLSLVNMSNLGSDYLIGYVCEIIKDECGVIRDVMLFYHKKMQELKNAKPSLMIVGTAAKQLCVQFYDFSKKEWCGLREIPDSNKLTIDAWTMLDNKFYYTSSCRHRHSRTYSLQVYNPLEKENFVLSSQNRLLSSCAVCACTEMLYFCGGEKEEDGFSSNQVLRYDPRRKLFETLAPMQTKRDSAAVTFYQGCLHVLGGFDEPSTHNSELNSIEKYDPDTKKWLAFPSMLKTRHSFGVAVLDEKLYACGGWNDKSVEVYNPSVNHWQLVSSMNKARFNFFVVVHEGKLLAVGGDREKTIEVYDPRKDQWQIDNELSSGLQIKYPAGGLVPSNYTS